MTTELTPLLVHPDTKREAIRQKVIEGIHESFPMRSRNKMVEITDVKFTPENFTSREQKNAILSGNTLFEAVKGTVVVKDRDSGHVIDTAKNFLLAKVPWFTPRHTVIVGGNEYSISSMVRPKPGVYTRKRANGVLEANFNVVGTKNFNITMDPEKGEPELEYDSTHIPLYPILRKSGLSHDQIASAWGRQLADVNQSRLMKNADGSVSKLYTKAVPEYFHKPGLSAEEKAQEIFSRYSSAHMDPEVNKQTLGVAHSKITPHSLLDASSKMLKIFRNDAEVDDRDNLDFKVIKGIDDYFKERIKLDAREVSKKVAIKIDAHPDIRQAIPTGVFTKGILQFINSSSLSTVPTQTNPMELVDAALRITALGEGGIGSERAIPMDARMVHPTQIGALDPVRTPESFAAGVDVRAAMMVKKDKDGNIHVPMIDFRTGRGKYVRAGEIISKVVAFPTTTPLKGKVDALVNGVVRKVDVSQVDYQLPHPTSMYSPAANLIPFLESNQGNRLVMGSKYQTQALSLIDREEPHVQVMSQSGKSFEELMGTLINPVASATGVVSKIDGDFVHIRADKDHKTAAKEDMHQVSYDTFLPMAAKTYLHHTLTVKEGDRVNAGQSLADSNFTKNGKLALGKNLSVAYMPYYGDNSNDAVVISEGAAKKLTSERMYKVVIDRDPDLSFNRDKHRTYYGHNYTKDHYSKLDEDGIVKPGTTVMPGDIVVAGLRKSQMTSDDMLLGRLHKSLARPYRESTESWDHDHAGEVVDVVKTPKRFALTIRTKEPMTIGDKIAGRFGDKGVVSRIIPDTQMIKDESGKPIDVIVTSAGVVGRINPAQILEGALGKVVEKTGKPILVENLTGRNNIQYVRGIMKEHGIKDKETVYDPIADKQIPNVFVGNRYMMKLFKSTDTNYSARGVESYDANMQPTKGGVMSSKALGKMEFDALVAHNARSVLQEVVTLKSQKNDEYWRALQLGLPTPPPKTTFASNKFLNMLTGAGVRVDRKGSKISLAPLTDKDIMQMSSGAITEAKLVRAKDLMPEKGGLFDPVITGGVRGEKWSHIELAEPIINPMFMDPVRRLLGMNNAQLSQTIRDKGGAHIKAELGKLDLSEKERELLNKTKTLTGSSLDDAVKQIKYIRALKSQNLKASDAYVVSKVPVVPPLIRPVLPSKGGQELMYGDINPLYRDLIYVNNQLKELKESGKLPEEEAKLRDTLHGAVGAVYGTNEPITQKSQARGHKGFLTYIAGVGSPKFGYFQKKLMSRSQDVTGRGTIVPDSTLGIDEVGLPENMIWGMYEPFLIRNLVRQGYPALQAKEMVKDKHPAARDSMLREIKERPVMINRAPTLHRYNIIGAYPVPVPGKTIRTSPFLEVGMNADYDGDSADCTLELATCVDGKLVLQSLHIGDFPHNEETKKVTGNKELYEVPANTFVFGYSEKNKRVQLCEVSHFSVHHDLEMVKVTLMSGRTVKVSQDHSMFGMNPETGELTRFKAEEGIGWGTPKPRKLFVEQKQEFLTESQDAPDLEKVPVDFNLGWVLGAWAGDGWVGHSNDKPNQVCLAKVDAVVRHTFTQRMFRYKEDAILREYSATHNYGGGDYTSTKIHINNTKLAKWFSGITEGVRGSKNKKLPSWFMHGKEDFLLGLLSGLLDTDGTVCSVKAVAKNKPQIMANYQTISHNLAVDVSTLLCLLGVKSRIHPYTKKESMETYYNVVISVPDLQRIAGQLELATQEKAQVLKELAKNPYNMDAAENARWDMVPISPKRAKALAQANGAPKVAPRDDSTENLARKQVSTTYSSLIQAVKKGRLSRSTLNVLRKRIGDDTVRAISGDAWFNNVTNDELVWDFVETVDHVPGRHTAWDLTVPDGCTFMTSEQIIVYDTLMVHTPVSQKAIEEVKKMTLSNLLYGDKSKDDLLAVPRHEAMMGISHASSADDKEPVKVFANRADVMKDYAAGKIGMGTHIKIKDSK